MSLKAISVTLMLTLSQQLAAKEINFLTHSVEGKIYTDENEEIRGRKHSGKQAFSLELVREMMIIMKHPTNFYEIPYKRGLKFVQNKPDFALFNMIRKPNYEDTIKWVGPLKIAPLNKLEEESSLLMKLSNTSSVQNPTKLQTGGYIGFSKNIADNVIQDWQNALEQLKNSGRYDELVKNYLLTQ